MRKPLIRLAHTVSIPAILLIFAVGWLFFRPQAPTHIFYDGCSKVWSHRALSDGPKENTIDGMRRALELGAPGVEIDVIFDSKKSDFLVISEEYFVQGERSDLRLPEMLDAVPAHGFIWIDLWNLKVLPDDVLEFAAYKLADLLRLRGLLNRTIVESTSEDGLAKVADRGVATCLWLEIRPFERSRRGHVADAVRGAVAYHKANFSAVSMDYASYSVFVAAIFSAVPIHLFTVNESRILAKITEDPRIKIVLSDRPLYARTCAH